MIREIYIPLYGINLKEVFIMTYKQIEASREVRLWICQILVPAFGIAMAIPEVRHAAVNKVVSIKEKLAKKSKKD